MIHIDRWLNQIICGDCLEVMRELPDKSVDAVVTDPPYGLNFPYLSYDDTRQSLKELIKRFIPEFFRISQRAFILCGPTQITLYPEPDWVSCITWNTTGTFGKYGYNQWTPVLCYGKDLPGIGNINGITKSDVLRISGGGGVGFMRGEEEKKHICPKPLNLMELVLRRFTAEHSVILDPFLGSGTTAVAALNTGRFFIGIEKEPKYVEIARRRVAQAQMQQSLFG